MSYKHSETNRRDRCASSRIVYVFFLYTFKKSVRELLPFLLKCKHKISPQTLSNMSENLKIKNSRIVLYRQYYLRDIDGEINVFKPIGTIGGNRLQHEDRRTLKIRDNYWRKS